MMSSSVACKYTSGRCWRERCNAVLCCQAEEQLAELVGANELLAFKRLGISLYRSGKKMLPQVLTISTARRSTQVSDDRPTPLTDALTSAGIAK